MILHVSIQMVNVLRFLLWLSGSDITGWPVYCRLLLCGGIIICLRRDLPCWSLLPHWHPHSTQMSLRNFLQCHTADCRRQLHRLYCWLLLPKHRFDRGGGSVSTGLLLSHRIYRPDSGHLSDRPLLSNWSWRASILCSRLLHQQNWSIRLRHMSWQLLLRALKCDRRQPYLRLFWLPCRLLLPQWYWTGLASLPSRHVQPADKPVQAESVHRLWRRTLLLCGSCHQHHGALCCRILLPVWCGQTQPWQCQHKQLIPSLLSSHWWTHR